MELGWALLIWLVVGLIVFFAARYYRITLWSSFVLALLVAGIVLAIVYPVTGMPAGLTGGSGLQTLYWLILFLSSLIFVIYIVHKAVTDREVVVRL